MEGSVSDYDPKLTERPVTSSLMIWVADHEQACTYLSPEWLEFTGRSREHGLGFGWLEDVHFDDRGRVVQTLRAAFDMRERFRIDYRLRRWDGEYRWIGNQGEFRLDSAGKIVDCVNQCVDVTEQRRTRDALQKTNEALDHMLATSSALGARLDVSGRVILWNEAARHALGWKRDDLVGASYRFVPASSLEIFRTHFERCLVGVTTGVEMQWVSAGDELINVTVSMVPIYDLDGSVSGVLLTAQNVAVAERLVDNVSRRAVFAEALRDTASTLTSSLDPETVMSRILDAVRLVVPHDAANIMQIHGDVARVTHMHGYPSILHERLIAERFSLDLPNYRRMVDTRTPNLIVDTRTEPHWVVFDDFDWIRAHISTPIYVEGRVAGFLNLDSGTPGAFVAEDAERLQSFADQVGIAIENARLFDALRRDAEELNMLHRASSFLFRSNLLATSSLDDIGRQFAVAVAEEFEQSTCAVFLVDERGENFYRLARQDDPSFLEPVIHRVDGPGLIAEATRTGKVIYAPDVLLDPRYLAVEEETRSELVIPLRVGKDTIGSLDLQDTRVDAYSAQDIHILQIFAERAATTMENARLVAQIRRYAAELEQRVFDRTAELHRVKERVEAILNSSSDAILMIGSHGTIEQTNQAFNRMFGYDVDEIFGHPLSAVARGNDQLALEAAIPQVILGREVVRLEIQAVSKTGSVFDAEFVMSPIAEVDQRVLSIVCNVRDITARKRVELELRHALESERELSELKSRFITTASHEFRTPLAMIMTSSDILKNYVEKLTLEQQRARIERIQAEVRNITRILDDLLTLSRSESDLICEPVALDVEALCRQILHDLSLQDVGYRRIDFHCEGEPTRGWLDSRLLRRILVNLLSNAVKFSQPDSRIELTLRCRPGVKVLEIRDNGYGIPKSDQDRLFEAFHRAKNVEMIGGTGLGLAIVKRAVDAHQGTIHFSSQLGVGTTFTVTLMDEPKKEGDDE